MFAVVPVMLFLMVTLLMFQLQSFQRVLPGAGACCRWAHRRGAALLCFNRPLGFVAILGILALIGMVARNAVILIEQIETERAAGKPSGTR